MKLSIVLICAALSLCRGQPPMNEFIDRKDRDLARKAREKVETACGNDVGVEELTEEDYAARREDLEKSSADNIILTVLQEADSPESMNAEITDKVANPSFLLFKAGPLIGFIFFLVLYVLYFCWACCPCCWCQCCRRKRNCYKVVKFIFLILIVVIILGLVIAAMLSIRGFNAASSGFKVTQCTAAQLVNDTMGGSEEQSFLGVIRTLEIFQDLKDSLDPGSPFLTQLEAILTNTKPISDAVVVASATMSNLKLMMEASANQVPEAAGEDLMHKCELCTILAPSLDSAITALEGGVGVALAATRDVVSEQLQGDNLAKLSDSMLAGTAPLVELKTIIHSAFGPFVEQDTLEAITVQLDSIGTLSSVALIGVALLLALCSILTGVCWICVDTHTAADGTSQHRRITCRCAICTWCCGCYYMLFVLLISGIMTAVAIPLSSICLVLEDVDSELIKDIAAPLELNISGAEGDMMISMVEQCFRNPDPDATPRILDLITVPGADPGTTMTMYELIVDQTQQSVNTQFDELMASMSTGDATLWNNDSPVKKLADMLMYPMSAMILPDANKLASQPMKFGALSGSTLDAYLFSGGSCDDVPIPGNAGFGAVLDGKTIEGIKDFGGALSGLAGASPDAGSPMTCVPPTGKATCAANDAVCEAGNELMDLKLKLRGGNIFRCWEFRKNNMACNVITQAGMGPGGSNGCLVNGQMDTREYACDIDEFSDMIQTYYALALQSTFQDLDAKTANLKNSISADLKALVDEQVLQKITTVGNGLTCGFLGEAYQGVLDGLCYGGVWGFQAMSASYVACAVLTIFLVILTFIVWRISYDNVLMNRSDPIQKYS